MVAELLELEVRELVTRDGRGLRRGMISESPVVSRLYILDADWGLLAGTAKCPCGSACTGGGRMRRVSSLRAGRIGMGREKDAE